MATIKLSLKKQDNKITLNKLDVKLSGGVEATGTYEIDANGVYNVKYFEFANVNVPIPEGYLKPEGTFETNIEGTYDVTPYASATFTIQKEQVSVTPTEEEQTLTPSENKYFSEVVVNPIPSEYIIPEGRIDITSTDEYDVTNYKYVQIVDENLKEENIAEGQTILGKTGTFRGGIDTSDGTITADKVLKDEVGYAKEERIVGTIETYDYSNSEEVSPEIDKLISRELTSIYNDRITTIGANAFYGYTTLESVNFPNVTSIGEECFSGCSSLEKIIIPNAMHIGVGAFSYTIIEEIELPNITTITRRIFYYANNLKTIYVPNVKQINAEGLYRAYSLTKLIIEQDEVVAPLGAVNAFNNCYHILGEVNATFNPEGLADGYIYVPDSLVEQYKVATNWSTFASQIKPLSELEVE